MKNIRLLLSGLVLLLLGAGYAASQIAALKGQSRDEAQAPIVYAQKIDSPPVQWTALLLLIVCIVFAFIRDREANET